MTCGRAHVETLELERRSGDRGARALARRLSRAGDFIALTGDLGAGKTAFARAFLRALTGDPELEAPSPTFTLIQTYDGPGLSDRPRRFLSACAAPRNCTPARLGRDDRGRGDAGRMAGARRRARCPPTGWRSRSRFDLARGDDFRRAELARARRDGRRVSSARAPSKQLLDGAGWAEARARAAARRRLDARLRAADRRRRPRRAILMISPPRPRGPDAALRQDLSRDRQALARHPRLPRDGRGPARRSAIRRRASMRYSVADGLALIEDFGDETIAGPDGPTRRATPRRRRCSPTCTARTLPGELPVDGETYAMPTYDIEAMLIEVELALDWYAPAIARGAPSSGARMQFLGLWREALAPVLARADDLDAARLSTRPNLHWLADRDGRQAARPDRFPGRGARARPPTTSLRCCRTRASRCPPISKCGCSRIYARRRARADPGFDADRLHRRLCGHGRAARDQDSRHFHPARPARRQAAISQASAAHRAHAGQESRRIPSLQPLRRWFETHLPRALGAAATARRDAGRRWPRRCPKTAMVFAAGPRRAHAADHRRRCPSRWSKSPAAR